MEVASVSGKDKALREIDLDSLHCQSIRFDIEMIELETIMILFPHDRSYPSGGVEIYFSRIVPDHICTTSLPRAVAEYSFDS